MILGKLDQLSDTKPDLFQKVPDLSLVVNRINNTLLTHFRDHKKTQQTVWEAIDSVVTLQVQNTY